MGHYMGHYIKYGHNNVQYMKYLPKTSVLFRTVAMDDVDKIDFKKLEKEFAAAVQADAKYQRENDAKFRAVEQRVGSYEEFRDIVAASHLKPLDRKDITGQNTRQQPWNPHVNRKDDLSTDPSKASSAIDNGNLKLPQTAHEFGRSWRRLCKTELEKYQLLCGVGGEMLQRIFKSEISFGLLGEFVQVLVCCWDDSDAERVYSILLNLSKTNRFGLSIQFLNDKEKHLCSEVFRKLHQHVPTEAETKEEGFTEQSLSELAKAYNAK